MKPLSMTAGALVAALLGGCASTPPAELKNARSAFAEASQSPGANLATTDVYEAKKSLDRAEAVFADKGDKDVTRDVAYVAERKAFVARARGNTALALAQKKTALLDAEKWKQQQAIATREQLGQAKNQLSQTQQQLDSERQARAAAEQRTADALAHIQGMSAKQEQRGLVLTLNGSVLFASGKSELLPSAQKRLDEVVGALKEDQRSITIAGHTDAVGNDDTNMALSQRRADAVRAYLVGHGIPDDRVAAKGMGKTQPVADNATAEGRANNRRVEIILNGAPDTRGKPVE